MSNLRWGQDPMSHAETDLDILFILCPAIIISFYIPSISKLFSFFIANSFPILRVQIALHVIYFHFYCFSSARFPLFLFLFYECCKFSSTQKEKKNNNTESLLNGFNTDRRNKKKSIKWVLLRPYQNAFFSI